MGQVLQTMSPATGAQYSCRLSVPPEHVPHYSHNPHLPLFFYGGWLSSFAPYRFRHPMSFQGREDSDGHKPLYPSYWHTREHWFQAHKTFEVQVCEAIASAEDPWTAKAIGNSRAVRLREDWDDGRSYDAMLEGIRIQLDAYDALRTLLLQTGDRFIAEVSPTDTIWGIHDRQRDAWDGRNLLGVAWMDARAEL